MEMDLEVKTTTTTACLGSAMPRKDKSPRKPTGGSPGRDISKKDTVVPSKTLRLESHITEGSEPLLDLSLATFAAGVHTAIPFESEVARRVWMESGHIRSRQHAALLGRIAELTAEVMAYADEMGELLDDLKKANLPPDLHCKARDLLVLIEIDRGMTVSAIANALQTVAYDMRSRLLDKYKGAVKIKLGCSPDPNDMDSMIVLAEVSPEMPAQATGGRLTLASDGTVVTRRESAQAFQLKLQEPEPDPLQEMFGKADGEAFGDLLRAKGVKEITLGTGDNQVKVKLAGGKAAAAKKAA